MTVQEAAAYLVDVAADLFVGVDVEPVAHVERMVARRAVPFKHVPSSVQRDGSSWPHPQRPHLVFVQDDLDAWLGGAPLEVIELGRGLVHVRPRV